MRCRKQVGGGVQTSLPHQCPRTVTGGETLCWQHRPNAIVLRDVARKARQEQKRKQEARERDRAAITRVIELLRERALHAHAITIEQEFEKELNE